MDDISDFFRFKRPWSKYKDLILDYYLGPYLAKVAKLQRPIAIVDCFAGPGRFDDGEKGSPLIIIERLAQCQARGTRVLGYFVENDGQLFANLRQNTEQVAVPLQLRHGDFHIFLDEISRIATTHSIFIYVDPIRPTDLHFHDLAGTYERLTTGNSVETLINFLTPYFIRIPQGIVGRYGSEVLQDSDHPEVRQCNSIAGGDYWIQAITQSSLSQGERVDLIADGYLTQFERWFRWVLKYPIREKYEDELPKYHLLFGSRYPDAVDLMNRAMVTARRRFVGARFVEGMLFANQPPEEVVDPSEIMTAVVETARETGRQSWKLLRVKTTMKHPCLYTNSEMNQAIKAAIVKGVLHSKANGTKVDEKADVWFKR